MRVLVPIAPLLAAALLGPAVGAAAGWEEARSIESSARESEHGMPEQVAPRYLDAARLFEAVARERPDFVPAYWRSSRSFWISGDSLPLDAVEERIARFGRAEELARRGLDLDADCAECMLWQFASMGRLRTTRGVWTGMRQLPEMAELLDRGVALAPDYADDEHNSTLGNLHYSSAIFYRILPDWFWVGWLLGVRGDKERALGHVQSALALHPARLDYQVELGSQLLCLGSTRSDDERLAEGERVLRAALLRHVETQDESRELDAARIMLARPPKSCGYSGDTWVEIDRATAMRAAKRSGFTP